MPDTASVPSEENDAVFVARAKLDRRAFAPLYTRYLTPVYRYCHGRLGSQEAAEDATSLVFARALAALPTCRDASFRPWLFAIAHNVIANTIRSWRPDRSLATVAEIRDRTPTPEEAALAADESRSLRALLCQLPPSQRDVVELRLAGLGGAEIASVLGRSRAAVDTAHSRALERLRDLLGVGTEGTGHERT